MMDEPKHSWDAHWCWLISRIAALHPNVIEYYFSFLYFNFVFLFRFEIKIDWSERVEFMCDVALRAANVVLAGAQVCFHFNKKKLNF